MSALGGRARRPVAPTSSGKYIAPLGRRKLPHEAPLWAKTEDQVFFITICCQPKGQNHLCTSGIANFLFETIAFRHQRGDWFMHLALLMPDHLHLLISFPSEAEIKKIIREWKSYVARKIGISWQRDFFDHRLRREESFLEKEDYIRANPVRAGLVRQADDWAYVWTPQFVGATEPSRPTEK
jgi:REP element-mobilizing transposase RayT